METINEQNIFTEWGLWHFYEMPKFLLGVWKNYILFALNYFSVLLLLKSLFSPWRNYRWVYPKGFHVVEFFNTLISNLFSRIIGAGMRLILIVAGILFQCFIIIAGAILFLGWLLVPFFIVAGILFIFWY